MWGVSSCSFILPCTWGMNSLTCTPLWLNIKCSFQCENIFSRETYRWFSLPLGQRKQCSFAASCVVNRHLQMTAGGNRANALPAVPPVGFPLLSCDWKCWLHFLWFQTCPEDSSVPAQTCCLGIRLLLPPLVRDWDERTKSEEGLRRRKNIYFAFT